MRPIAYRLKLGDGNLHFVPAGCLHWPIGEKDLLRKWVREVASLKNAFTVLMGDSLDCARTHYRDHQRTYRADQNSQLAIDEMVKRDVRELAKELEPIKDRIAGVILGNHFWEFADGTNSEQYLCQILGLTYLGPVGIIRLDIEDRGRVVHHLSLYCHHNGGSRGGRTTSADVRALEGAEGNFDADIFCLSHTHRRYATKAPKIGLTAKGTPRIVSNTKLFIRSGAFLKGYGEDLPTVDKPHFPTYAEAGAYRPTDLGWVKVEIQLRHSAEGGPMKRDFLVTY